MEHRSLTGLLGHLLQRVDYFGDGGVGSHELPEWPDGALDQLVAVGLLARASNERGLVCDECEEACWLQPTWMTTAVGEDLLVSTCRLGKPFGLLTFPPERLLAWTVDLEGVARAIAHAFGIDGDPAEIEPGWAWDLGRGEIAGSTRRVYFAAGLGGASGERRWTLLRRRLPPEDVVVLVPARGPESPMSNEAAVVPLVGLVEVTEGRLFIPPDRLARALGGPTARAETESTEITWRATPDSRWNQVKVWLVDGDTVRLIVPGRPPRSFTAAELGLAHKRSRSRQRTMGWRIVEALCEGHGTCGWHTSGARSFDAFKVQVSQLGRKLQRFVGIEGSPFFPLREREGFTAGESVIPSASDGVIPPATI